MKSSMLEQTKYVLSKNYKIGQRKCHHGYFNIASLYPICFSDLPNNYLIQQIIALVNLSHFFILAELFLKAL